MGRSVRRATRQTVSQVFRAVAAGMARERNSRGRGTLVGKVRPAVLVVCLSAPRGVSNQVFQRLLQVGVGKLVARLHQPLGHHALPIQQQLGHFTGGPAQGGRGQMQPHGPVQHLARCAGELGLAHGTGCGMADWTPTRTRPSA